MNFYDWFFKEELADGTKRAAAGLFSFQHLITVTLTLAIFVTLAFFLGKRYKNDPKKQNLILLITGINIIALQVLKYIFLLIETDNIVDCLIGNLPLYFCDIATYIIPLAALTKGRFKDICIDFVAICGVLMGFMGNYFAGNLYPSHALVSWAVFNALINHSLSAFAAMFIWFSAMNKMERKNILYTIGILFSFMTLALIIDYIYIPIQGTPKNFMFFFHGDGTPFTLFDMYMSFGLKPIYQLWIYILQCGYMAVFYSVYYPIKHRLDVRKAVKEAEIAKENA
jgi:hypothetical protein